jgi:ATPase subunit of ABC transporter with duplicated ATPase domains
VGIIGPNGAGKTTLSACSSAKKKTDAGSSLLEKTVKFGYVDQGRASLETRQDGI